MSEIIKIGHATGSEYGSKYGVAGDSTGNEVKEDPNYNITKRGYHVLLRPISSKFPNLAETSARACEAGCRNNYIGYSQAAKYDNKGRESLYQEAVKKNFDLSKITTACNTDCSAFMAVCAIAGGAAISPSVYTGNMVSAFVASGAYEKRTDALYFNSSDYLKRGDILVKEGSHTIMILANGSKISAAEIPSSPQTDASVDTQWIKDFFAIKIAADITSIAATEISAKAKIAVIKDGEEKSLDDFAGISHYNWTCNLSSLTSTAVKPVSKKLKISSSTTSFSLTGLRPASSYRLRIIAKERNNEVEYSSPDIIFTTAKEPPAEKNLVTEFKDINSDAKDCLIFIRIEDDFKQAVLYNR